MEKLQSPDSRSKDVWFWVFCAIGVALFYAIKFVSPHWVAYLFRDGNFTLLNTIVNSPVNENLDFYSGRIEEILFGPLTQLISGLLFAWICLRNFVNISGWKFALVIFIFLLFTKFEVLMFPPYGDAIGGPFAEALWLSQHGFDYVGLFHQPSYDVGGPRVYLFSIYPTFLAVFLKIIPSTAVFLVIQHLLVFFMASAIVAMTRAICLKVFNPSIATLSALVLLYLPLFQSQVEAINMEMSSALFIVWSAYALLQNKNGLAVLFAIVSALIKGTGVLACGGAAIVLCFKIFQAKAMGERLKLFVWVFTLTAFGALLVSLKFIFKDAHINEGMVRFAAGWPSMRNEFVFYLFLFCSTVFLIYYGVAKVLKKQEKDFLTPLVMLSFAAMWFLLFINFYAVSPRYRVALYPFLIFAVVYVVMIFVRIHRVQLFMLWAALALALYSSYGIFYGSVPDNDHVMLERSLEYRNDLELNRRLVRAAEERYSDKMIVAPFTIAQAMAIPQLGYVHKKLRIMIYGFSLQYGGIANYPGLKNLNLKKTVFVGVKIAPIAPDFPFPVGSRDVILEEIAVGNKEGSFFVGGFAIEALWRVTHGLNLN